MRKYGFDNEYGTTFSYGIRFLEFPKFNYGYEVIEKKNIPGRIGTLSVHTGRYTDTTITNVFEFVSDTLESFEIKLQEIKDWLMKTRILTYTDSEDRFFQVKKVEFSSVTRKYGIYGNITVIFTCEPFVYLKSGNDEIGIDEVVYNSYSWAQPIYQIIGAGECILTVNGNSITANVLSDITIDTKLMIAYRSDGTSQNTAISGDYEDLYLQAGENNISVTEGFECKIIPRWRCL